MNYRPYYIVRNFDNLHSSKATTLGSFLALSLACYLAFFYHLADPALSDPDEGRSGVIAKEMVNSGNWVTLTHNGRPYHDKPVLYFWLVALGLKIFGLTEFAVRLPSALAASLTVGAVYLWGSLSGGWRRGFWGGIVLVTSLGFSALGRFGKMDMLFSFFLSAGLLYFLWWHHKTYSSPIPRKQDEGPATQSGTWIWPFYVFLALASLTKGPVGVLLPLLIVGLTLGPRKRWGLLREIHLLRGIVVMLLVTGPWFLWAGLREPEFITTFLWDHNILRFFNSQQGIDHSEPVYYFLPVLLAGFLPWTFFLPVVLHHLWEKRGDQGHEERLFLFVWFVAIFIFFSLSVNKLGTYILPAFPPLALLTGDFFSQFAERGESGGWRKRWIFVATGIWLLLLVSIPPVSEMMLKHRYPQYLPFNVPLFPTAVLILLTGLAWIIKKEKWTPWIVSFSLLWLILWFFGEKASQISELRSTRSLARILTEIEVKDYRVVIIRAESFPFYFSRHVQIVSNPALIEKMLQEPIPTVAVIKEKHLKQMHRIPPSRLFVWKIIPSARALVANFPRPPAHKPGK
ncbi:MAG: glycosyltransferase family 39 protein [Deltaproteobacteria bacterium]|nr:glycosyltransferase family 39 protein [Deltaproteobacteria bacterium]